MLYYYIIIMINIQHVKFIMIILFLIFHFFIHNLQNNMMIMDSFLIIFIQLMDLIKFLMNIFNRLMVDILYIIPIYLLLLQHNLNINYDHIIVIKFNQLKIHIYNILINHFQYQTFSS